MPMSVIKITIQQLLPDCYNSNGFGQELLTRRDKKTERRPPCARSRSAGQCRLFGPSPRAFRIASRISSGMSGLRVAKHGVWRFLAHFINPAEIEWGDGTGTRLVIRFVFSRKD